MEPNFPSNSQQRARGAPERNQKKEIQKVTQGSVARRKKPMGKRFTQMFFGGDARSAWGFMAYDILVPAVKDAFEDMFTMGMRQMLWGEAADGRRHRRRRGGGHTDYGSYSRYERGGGRDRDRDHDRDEGRRISRRARMTHDFDEIILDTRREAEDVIDNMFELVSKYEVVTVAELYDLVGIDAAYTDQKWGWYDLRGAKVERVGGGGYLLDLPRPESLD